MSSYSNVHPGVFRTLDEWVVRVSANGRRPKDEREAGEVRPGRGRKKGSRNWSQERYYRRYRVAAREMRRPYRWTHMAARMGVAYNTLKAYYSQWGPPSDCAGIGD